MRLIKLLIILLSFNSLLISQQIQFCKSVNADGKPVEHKTAWDIKKGTTIFIHFNYVKPINSSMVYMFIDKMVSANYEAYDSKAISVEANRTWLSYGYTFLESGKYDVYFISNSGERLAQNKLTIKVTDAPAEKIAANEAAADKRILNTDIVFCDNVIANKPINPKESVSLKSGGNITVYIRSEETFKTSMLIVQIYKRESSVIEDLVQTKKFKAQTNWRNVFFKYKFTSIGKYKFSVYDEFENIIKSAVLTVTE